MQQEQVIPSIRPVGHDVPVARPFKLKYRSKTTVCVSYFETEGERSARAAALVVSGVTVTFLPSDFVLPRQ